MRKSAIIPLIAILALILTACQSSPGGSEPGKDPATAEDDHQAHYFAAEYDLMTRIIGKELAEHCQSAGALASMQKCFRAKLIDAFDTPMEGQRACRPLANIDAYVECISMGSLAADMRSKIAPAHRPDMLAADWRRPQPFLDKLVAGFAVSIVDVCTTGKAAAARSCIRREMPRQLQIVEPLQQRCEQVENDIDYGACIGEAMGLQFFQHAAVRLSMREA